MLLTATAPPRVLDKMRAMLTNPVELKASVDRPNISLKVEKSKYGGKVPKAVMDGKTSAGETYYIYIL